MEQELITRLTQAIKDRVFPGCVFGFVKKDGSRIIVPLGRQTYDTDSPVVTENTIYDVASITKSVTGSAALLKLIDEKKLSLKDKVEDFIPGFGNYPDKKLVTIEHVLTYTLDFEIEKMSILKNLPPDEIIKTVITAKLKSKPGTVYKYVNATALLIHLIVEKITGTHIDTYVSHTFYKPLGMTRTTFHPEAFPILEIAPTEIDDWRGGEVRAVVHDESSFALRTKSTVAVAGLFSTVPDLLRFEEMLLQGGEYKGRRYFSEEIVQEMHTNHFRETDMVSLGWELNQSWFMGTFASETTFGKTGFTGCHMVIDPKRECAFVLLSNRTYPKRPADSTITSAINSVRRDIADSIERNI